jgi:hypothetical protein
VAAVRVSDLYDTLLKLILTIWHPTIHDKLAKDFDKMGGFGSGGWNATGKSTTSNAKPLDVNNLNKRGALQSGTFSQSSWTRGDEPAGDIQIRAHEGFIKLIYKARTDGGDWQKVDETVPLVWMPIFSVSPVRTPYCKTIWPNPLFLSELQ